MGADSRSVVIAALVAGLLAGYGVAIPVGAVATYLVALTARTSWKIGACAALGVATADGLYALIAAIGGSALAGVLEPIVLPLHWVSGLVLIALAVRGSVVAIGQYRTQPATTMAANRPVMTGFARVYLGLWGITMLNPLTLIYFAALVVGSRTTVVVNRQEQVVFVLAVFAASASWQLLLAGGGALLGRVLTGRRGRLVTAIASSTVITALAVSLLTSMP